MKTQSDSNVLVLPPALLAEVEAAADETHRPVADVVREALERYLLQLHAGNAKAADMPAPRSPAEAAARIRENRKGNVLPEGVTIRDLMTHGRA